MEINEIRAKKLEEIRRKIEEKRRLEILKKQYLSKFLSIKARERLARVRMVKPEVAEYVENLLISLYNSGKIRFVDDKTLKGILERIYERTKRNFNIRIIRK